MFNRVRHGLLLAVLCAFGTVSAQGYRVDDLGALDGNTSWAWAINDRGDVAGWSSAGVNDEAFVAKPRTGMRGLGRLPHTRASYALGVNDAGLATGYSGLAFETVRSFAWTGARGLVDLGSLGGASSWARALNNRGQIVGESETADGEIHMFWWSAGRMADLGTPPGERFAQAESISDVGHVAGNAGGPFLWRNGVFTPLPSLGGFGLVHDVNDFGAAVGSSALGDGACSTCETRAALWVSGTVRNLGLLAPPDAAFMTSVAHSINNPGRGRRLVNHLAERQPPCFLLRPRMSRRLGRSQ